jgi:putative spermidine/putrescine transport system ATP-binding protein
MLKRVLESTDATGFRKGHRLTIDHVTIAYDLVRAVDDIALSVEPGEILALLGPSGCGKTSLLRCIAGFVKHSAGQILLDGVPVDALPPMERGIGIVFQNYALFPHMTVVDNIGYGLAAHRKPKREIRDRVEEMLALVQMVSFGKRYPRELSGGQQQRVALARALAVEPRLLLLDEPFGALDRSLRMDMQAEVKRLQRALGITSIMVTHDQEEALSMADKIAVLNHGHLEQLDSPTDVYDKPASIFVANFVGASNVLYGTVSETGERAPARITLRSGEIIDAVVPNAIVGRHVALSIRPENLELTQRRSDSSIRGEIKLAMPLGPTVAYEIAIADGQIVKVTVARRPGESLLAPDATVYLKPISPTAFVALQ